MNDDKQKEAVPSPIGEEILRSMQNNAGCEHKAVQSQIMDDILRTTHSAAAMVIVFGEPYMSENVQLKSFHISSVNISWKNTATILFAMINVLIGGVKGGTLKFYEKDIPQKP